MEKVERRGGVVVSDRPQISVELVDNTTIEITVSGLDAGFSGIETNSVFIPADCGKEVAKAILSLLKR